MSITTILIIMSQYHVKYINDNSISVIASYKSQLEEIANKHNIKLTNVFNNDLTVQGIFTI